MIELRELYDELFAISLIDIDDSKKRGYLTELIIDYRRKLGNHKLCIEEETYYRDNPEEGYNQIVDDVLLDNSLPMEQKIRLLRNFKKDEIISKSKVRRLSIQKERKRC